MSVYPRTNASGETRFRYDFQFAGQRCLSQEPHYATRAKAEKAERDERKRLARGGDAKRSSPNSKQVDSRNTPLASSEAPKFIVTLEQACERFWRDVGQRHRSAADIRRRLDHVRRIIGADDKVRQGGIAAIGTAVVIDAMQKRLAEETLTRYGRPSGKLVTGPGANRDIIDQLRPVLNHAAMIWEDDGLELRAIKWKMARQAEADEQVCEFTEAEIVAWGEALTAQQERRGRSGATERAFLTLALEYGPRLGELFFHPDSFRPDAPGGAELELGRYTGKGGVVRTSRKDDSLHAVTLMDDTVELLAPLVDRALTVGAATIWIESDRDGEPVPISYDAMRYRLLAAAKRAGIDQARTIHGMRHHAGSSIARTGGLVRCQQLLGHKQITTSRRYAHANKDDLRAALTENRVKKSRPSPAQNGTAENGPAR